MNFKKATNSGTETKKLAAQIGSRLKGGEIFLLHGDLGYGKTEFVKGLVEGAGIIEEVSSPSFTISNVYKGINFTIHHMDYYRVGSAGLLGEELLEVIEDKNNVTVIEWPDIVAGLIPSRAVNLVIRSLGDDNRELSFDYHSDYDYLFEGVA